MRKRDGKEGKKNRRKLNHRNGHCHFLHPDFLDQRKRSERTKRKRLGMRLRNESSRDEARRRIRERKKSSD